MKRRNKTGECFIRGWFECVGTVYLSLRPAFQVWVYYSREILLCWEHLFHFGKSPDWLKPLPFDVDWNWEPLFSFVTQKFECYKGFSAIPNFRFAPQLSFQFWECLTLLRDIEMTIVLQLFNPSGTNNLWTNWLVFFPLVLSRDCLHFFSRKIFRGPKRCLKSDKVKWLGGVRMWFPRWRLSP